MKASKFIAAAAVILAAGSAFAADATPVASSAVTAAAAVAVPTVQISKSRDRADVKAEAVDFARNHKTALAVQLEQYKN